MPDKDFKTIEQQLQILKNRGLSVSDENMAKNFLMKNNYYRISGYSLTLRDHDVFSSTACFQNIVDIYRFDHELRHILLKYIDKIEVKMKSIYAYRFAEIYGPTQYLNASLFSDIEQYNKTMAKVYEQINRRKNHEAYLKHFVIDLKQDIPLWALVDLMTIADISQLYSITESSVKNAIARDFGISFRTGADLLGTMMKSMTIIRNLCAHGSRLYNRLFEQKPWLSTKEKDLLIKDDNGDIDNAHLYGFMFIIKRLLEPEDMKEFRHEIETLKAKIPFVNMKYYGFRNDWEKTL